MSNTELGLSAERSFDETSGILTVTISEVEYTLDGGGKRAKDIPAKETGRKFTREVSFDDVLGAAWRELTSVGKAALEFGEWTAIRNGTGGKSLDEAEEKVDAQIAAHENGMWTERRARGMRLDDPLVSASSPWIAAMLEVYPAQFPSKADAVTWANAPAKNGDWEALDDKAKKAARAAMVARLEKDKKLALVQLRIKGEREQAANARKLARLQSAEGQSII